ncbi:MAG: alpha/beta fold hydrolase [bacterium]|nr:alpha/beta fold hydrolase [bacterium]
MSEPVDASAFDLSPPGFDGRAAALLLHGFTGTPYEMRLIADELVSRGVRCVGPVMAGHHATHVELAPTTWQEWVELPRKRLAELRSSTEHVFVAGMSMGGLVTLALAASEMPDAIAVMGVPLELPRSIRWRVRFGKFLRPYHAKDGSPDIREPEARDRHPGMDMMPLACMHEIVKLQKHVRCVLPKINAPTFVGHGAHDETANPKDASRIFSEINAGAREIFIGERSGHVVSVDYDGPECAKRIAEFFVRQVRP